MTRGPVHEAFAAPTATNPEPTAAVDRQPPEPIEEEAPDYKPEGAIWIPGYWEWDQAASDFLWVSGMWRVPPPEMRWIPTYWTKGSDGWQRVPGAWFSTETREVVYRETPPDSLEVGPSTPSPGDDHFYVPGNWVYHDTGYRWRTGYWTPYRENWVWCPARWYWTPRGCFYTAGYWDYQPGFRGQLFAPIAFTSAVYLQPGFRYRPWCVIDTNRFYTHLWIGPHAHCYYFGDYYPLAARWGFQPWCDWSYRTRICYDPLWSWCHVHYGRQGVDFIDRTRGWHRYYERNERERPPETFVEQQRLVAAGSVSRERGQIILGAELREIASRGDSALPLTQVDTRQRETVRKVTKEIRELNTRRRQTETDTRVVVGADGRPGRDPSVSGEAGGLKLPEVSPEVRQAAAAVKLPKTPDAERGNDDAPLTTRRPDDRTRTDQPGAERPRTDRPGADRPGTDRPGVERPGADRPATDRPSADRPGTDRPGADRPSTDRPGTDPDPRQPKGKGKKAASPDRPDPRGKDAPRVERPREDSPRPDLPSATDPRRETPRAELPSADRPRSEPPSTEPRSTDPRPRSTTPRAESKERKPKEPKSKASKTKDSKSKDSKSKDGEPKASEPKEPEPKEPKPKEPEPKEPEPKQGDN